jgi:pimeloyl-ACP methyl ester carboxylesterase
VGGHGRQAALAVALVTVGVLAACSDGGSAAEDRTAPSTSSAAEGTPSPTTTYDVPEMVDIGGGRQVYAHCSGEGSPTVVLESGDESDQFQWSSVFYAVAERTRVCAYDRFGTGSSDPASGCRRTPELLADLRAVLAAVDAAPPYVLVGTSGGGFIMTSYAYAHPDETAGIVLAETPHAIIPSQVPEELLRQLDCRAPTNVEHRDYVAVERYAWEHRQRVGRIPMTVISNDYGDFYENEEQRTNVKGQRGWLELSPLAKQVVVTTGHDVPENEPDLTVREILRVVDEARG